MENDFQNISYANDLSFNDSINNYSEVKPIHFSLNELTEGMINELLTNYT